MRYLIALILIAIGFYGGFFLAKAQDFGDESQEQIVKVQTVIYRYPNTPPYEAFPDPIDFDQALILLHGMRASHISALHWTFESDPGFGIADKDFQEWCIESYNQLIDFVWRTREIK